MGSDRGLILAAGTLRLLGHKVKTPVSIIILTYNEEANIRLCLESVKGFTEDIFIVDSFSTDKTLEIAREYTDKIFQNAWTSPPVQRQWALANLPCSYEWVLFVDADECLTETLRRELQEVVAREMSEPRFGGYYLPWKFFFLGKHIRWGDRWGIPGELRLCHRNHVRIDDRGKFEIYVCDLEVSHLKEALIHEDHKPLTAWIDRHNRYSSQWAEYLWKLSQEQEKSLLEKIGSGDRKLYRKEFIREKILHKLPVGVRPFLFFLYFYFVRLGILDGGIGFIYHILHTFYYQLLVEAKFIELKNKNL